jgi:hypothetical protein
VQLADDADSLRVGMSIEEARQRYGEPLKQYATAFGYGSDDQWDGFVLVYGGARDPRFLHYKQPLKHRLVFALTATDTLLNSWDFDEAEEVLLKDPW